MFLILIPSQFSAHYTGATKAGFIRRAYHFARPGVSPGAVQARFFAVHVDGWTADGLTLPGMLDLESGCSRLSKTAMVNWINGISNNNKTLSDQIYREELVANVYRRLDGIQERFPLGPGKLASTPGPILASSRSWQRVL